MEGAYWLAASIWVGRCSSATVLILFLDDGVLCLILWEEHSLLRNGYAWLHAFLPRVCVGVCVCVTKSEYASVCVHAFVRVCVRERVCACERVCVHMHLGVCAYSTVVSADLHSVPGFAAFPSFPPWIFSGSVASLLGLSSVL